MKEKAEKTISNLNSQLDSILEELGDFGKYQKINYILMLLPLVFNAFSTTGYIFTATDTKHRCLIPECDVLNITFKPTWISNAIPESDSGFDSCSRFASNTSVSYSDEDMCESGLFDKTRIEKCETWVYENYNSIRSEFDLGCQSWRSTLVGTISSVGQFIFMPFSGYISDKFGRKTVMIGGLVGAGIMGFVKSFSNGYWFFIIFEFLEAGFISGTFAAAFILAMELVSPKQRVLGSTLISSFYAIGEILIGTIGLYFPYWRTLLKITNVPIILLISYIWLMPESLRWLINNGRSNDVRNILLGVARINKVNLSNESLDILNNIPEASQEEERKKPPMKLVFKSSILMTRLLCCSFWWITCTLTFYGLSLNSVALAGNMYINFILVAIVELPGFVLYFFIIDKFGRKTCLSCFFIGGSISCISFAIIPSEFYWLRISLYLFGKLCITVAFTVVYVYTTELFPTLYRHSLLATCSMFGRLGSIIAPQTPLLSVYLDSLPLILFGGASLLSGIIVLFFPETLHIKLPDTIEEAEDISKAKNKL